MRKEKFPRRLFRIVDEQEVEAALADIKGSDIDPSHAPDDEDSFAEAIKDALPGVKVSQNEDGSIVYEILTEPEQDQ